MKEFILTYWIQILFGLVVAALGFLGKKFWSLSKKEVKEAWKDEYEKDLMILNNNIKNCIDQLRQENIEQNTKIEAVYNGVITLYKESFKRFCHKLLREDYEITLQDYEACQNEYATYKAIGANGEGDILFGLVKEKAKHLTD